MHRLGKPMSLGRTLEDKQGVVAGSAIDDILSGAASFAETVIDKALNLVIEVENHSRIRLLFQIAGDMTVADQVEFDDRPAYETGFSC
jgi:hypothetical protein